MNRRSLVPEAKTAISGFPLWGKAAERRGAKRIEITGGFGVRRLATALIRRQLAVAGGTLNGQA
ncbi:MAG: hypothetical protein ACUVTH_13355, partial [Thermogutta sp.]